MFARCAPRGLSHNPLGYSYGYPYSYSYGEYPYGYGGYGPDYSYYYNSYAAAQIAYEADAQQAAEGEQSRADWRPTATLCLRLPCSGVCTKYMRGFGSMEIGTRRRRVGKWMP